MVWCVHHHQGIMDHQRFRLAMSLVRFFMLLSLVVWVGGIIFFAFAVAPTVFTVLPTHELAGRVVTRSLGLLHWVGVGSGIVFLILSTAEMHSHSGHWNPFAARNLSVLGMIALTLVSQLVVTAKMTALRASMGDIDQVAVSDPRRVAFNQLHVWSTRLESVVLLLGLIVIYLLARQWHPGLIAASSL